MFEKILLPLDGTELSEMALPYGEEFASRLGSELVLYHVDGHERAQQHHMHQVYLDRLAETVQINIHKNQTNGKEVKVTTKVEPGEPAENICKLVDETKVDLIIMTAVSVSGLKIGKMLGSVVDHLCRTVPIPVLLLRPKSIPRIEGRKSLINQILITLDGSELSKLALPVGEELAIKLKAGVSLFQMANMIRVYSNGMGYEGAYIDYTKFDEAEKKRVSTEMNAIEKSLNEKDIKTTNIVISGYDAASEILDISKKADVDLIVMSTHGRSGLGRWVLGNVAERVVRHSEIPVLLVNARAG